MGYKNIKVIDETHEKFEKLKFDLRFKTKITRTQDELVNMLMDFFKKNYKGGKCK